MSEVVSAINAKPETIRTFLCNYDYVIPDYQRPYSWGKDECIRLWEDLINFFEETRSSNHESPYFLGNIVIYNESKKRYVVDGQQRLITLNILARALFTKNNSYKVLERILYKHDPLTGDVKQPFEIKIEHNVLGDNEENKLKDVLINRTLESNYKINYDIFLENIEIYFFNNSFSAQQIQDFLLMLIDNVMVLPIECTDFDSALTIFETINNRGMDLSDADIFKSKLYKNSGDQKDDFVAKWNDLVASIDKIGIDLKDIFSHLMHVIRGQENNVDSIMGLRKFYDQNQSSRLKNWNDVMNSLDKLTWGWNYFTNETSSGSAEIINWGRVLLKYPNSYWQYPIMTFLHENIDSGNDYKLDDKKDDFLELMKETTRYCYWKWLKYRGVNAIKDTIFKTVREVANGGDYKKIYRDEIKSDFQGNDKRGFQNSLRSILNSDLGKGLKGVCLLNVLLNDEQKNCIIPEDFQIEHILPQKWDNYRYSDWTNSTYKQYYNLLVNLIPLERELNIKSSHRLFPEKKIYYNQSVIVDVRDMGKLNDWTPDGFKDRNNQVISRFIKFFIDDVI
jgi:uncharacterized protein with ParB-like and HNH nuclease domain